MNLQDRLKKATAEAALEYIEDGMVIGVGTGSTVNHFIDALAPLRDRIDGAVSSSEASSRRLLALGIRVLSLNDCPRLPLYVDGTDETNPRLQLIKGGGGALTREKIVASASDRYICIADSSKQVDMLGDFGVPLEVIPMARAVVESNLRAIGGEPVLRPNFVTDNGNLIIDVRGLRIADPARMEDQLNAIPGIVTNGIFARNAADLMLIGSETGVRALTPQAIW